MNEKEYSISPVIIDAFYLNSIFLLLVAIFILDYAATGYSILMPVFFISVVCIFYASKLFGAKNLELSQHDTPKNINMFQTEKGSVCTFSLFGYNAIIVPKWSSDSKYLIDEIEHELQHIKRGDFLFFLIITPAYIGIILFTIIWLLGNISVEAAYFDIITSLNIDPKQAVGFVETTIHSIVILCFLNLFFLFIALREREFFCDKSAYEERKEDYVRFLAFNKVSEGLEKKFSIKRLLRLATHPTFSEREKTLTANRYYLNGPSLYSGAFLMSNFLLIGILLMSLFGYSLSLYDENLISLQTFEINSSEGVSRMHYGSYASWTLMIVCYVIFASICSKMSFIIASRKINMNAIYFVIGSFVSPFLLMILFSSVSEYFDIMFDVLKLTSYFFAIFLLGPFIFWKTIFILADWRPESSMLHALVSIAIFLFCMTSGLFGLFVKFVGV